MKEYIISGALMLAVCGGGFLLYLLLTVFIRRQTHIFLKGLSLPLKTLKAPLRVLFPFIGASAALPFLPLPQNITAPLGKIIYLGLMASLSWLIIKCIYVIRDALLRKFDITVIDNRQARRVHTQIRLAVNIIVAALVFLSLAFILLSFPQVKHVGATILASAGIAGIVIGFAAQKTLGNVIAGIQIAISQPISLDDVVIVENEWGWIEEITLTYVVVRIWDLRRLVVPIGYFIDKPFQNWTRKSADILGTVEIYADYSVPVKDVRDELTRILENNSLWDKKVNVLQVTDVTQNSVVLRALMSATNSPALWNLRCHVREKLLEFLQQRHAASLPRIRVEMKEG